MGKKSRFQPLENHCGRVAPREGAKDTVASSVRHCTPFSPASWCFHFKFSWEMWANSKVTSGIFDKVASGKKRKVSLLAAVCYLRLGKPKFNRCDL